MIEPVYHVYDTVGSTNDIALTLAKKGAPEGTVVTAKAQTGGRGRLGRRWEDEHGKSAILSIVVRPQSLDETAMLAIVAGLSVYGVLDERCGADALLKWPNDVMIGGRKVAGILVETTQTDTGLTAVVGIGLNVQQTAFPVPIANTATSVLLATGRSHDPALLGRAIAERFLDEWQALAENGPERLAQRWTRLMWGAGRTARVETAGTVVIGRLLGIDEDARLLVREESGACVQICQADSIALLD